MILLRQVSRYVYDVFAGKGWPNADAVPGACDGTWSRVRKQHWGVTWIAGQSITRVQAKQLLSLIEANPAGSLNPLGV